MIKKQDHSAALNDSCVQKQQYYQRRRPFLVPNASTTRAAKSPFLMCMHIQPAKKTDNKVVVMEGADRHSKVVHGASVPSVTTYTIVQHVAAAFARVNVTKLHSHQTWLASRCKYI